MTKISRDIEQKLISSGLHEESVKRMISHYKETRLYLGTRKYEEAGLHVGKFCEDAGNIILQILGQPIEQSPQMDIILQKIDANQKNSIDPMIRITIPRFLRAAYDMRSKRDSVHTNLAIPVNHADAHVSVHICSWVLSEFIRVYGSSNMDEAAKIIEELSRTISPYVDEYNGIRLLMSNTLSVSDEILVHLYNDGNEVNVSDLINWIPNADSNHVRTCLRQLRENRFVHYDGDKTKITMLGIQKSEDIIKSLNSETSR